MAAIYVGGRGAHRVIEHGMTTGVDQFVKGASHTLERLSAPLERLGELVERPEDLGFALLGQPDTRLFRVDPRGPTGGGGGGTAGGGPGGGGPAGGGGAGPKGQEPDSRCPLPEEPRARQRVISRFVAALPEAPDDAQLETFDCYIAASRGATAHLVRFLVVADLPDEVARSRAIVRALLAHESYRAAHGLSPEQLADILANHSPHRVIQQAADHGLGSLRRMTKVGDAPPPTAAPVATKAPRPPTEPTQVVGARPNQSMEFFSKLFRGQAQYDACVGIQAKLTKSYRRFAGAQGGGQVPLDLAEMKDLGILDQVPLCPGNGRFQLDPDGAVACSVHGNPAAPWPARRDYMLYFRPWEIARDLLEGGRHKEALLNANRFLKTQPKHVWMQEIRGEAAMALEKFTEAADSYYAMAKKVRKNDVWTLYQAGQAFYASDNLIQAKDHLERLLKAADWENGRRRFVNRLEYYRTVERARWLLENFVAPAEPGAAPVRFLEFKVAREPVWPVVACRDNLYATRERINGHLEKLYASPELTRLARGLRLARRQRAELRAFETGAIAAADAKIERLNEAVAAARREAGGSSNAIAALAEDLIQEGVPAHPGANYRVDLTGDLHCLTHPHLLEDASLIGAQLLESERQEINRALSNGILATQPAREECYQRQRTIGDGFGPDLPAGRYSARGVSRRMGLGAASRADCPAPGPGGGYRFDDSSGYRLLTCGTHGSQVEYFGAYAPGEGGRR